MSTNTLRPKDEAKSVHRGESASELDEEEEFEEGGSRFLLFNVMPAWMVSFLAHLVIIIVLAILVLPPREELTIALVAGAQTTDVVEDLSINLADFEPMSDSDNPLDTEFAEEETMQFATELDTTLPEANIEFELRDFGATADMFDGNFSGEMKAVNETSSRTGEAKRMALNDGATPASEQAVALALKWIIDHQLPDGGWNFDHTFGLGGHRDSPNPGSLDVARNAATAMALLPLLGAGHTHKFGEYQAEVAKGLEFLKRRGLRTGKKVSYVEQGGSMYSHGLVAIVFCEAYAMTQDSELAPYAQGVILFTEDAQDPIGGGWRYRYRERGDTSAVGWQMMALKSGKISGLEIKPRTYKRVKKFLDSVSSSGGAFYGYTDPPRGEYANARTAIGLLCRMYMGWDKDNPGLVDGTDAIADEGPSIGVRADMYYNYYATQVMKHMGGRNWKDWNVQMRDFLVQTQSKAGNSAGSWFFEEWTASGPGGRLYNTSLACMTLEVYYRFLPLYGDKAANDEFQLIE